ncbi:hypothetical protein Tco_1520070, partial [Tanacetum coccineum]
YRVLEVVFWVKKGNSAHVYAGSGSGGSIRRVQSMDMAYLSTVKPRVSTAQVTTASTNQFVLLDWDQQVVSEHIHDVTWRLYDSCGVHHVSTEKGIDMSRGTLTLMLVAKLLVDQDNEMSKELLKKIFMQVERPRR